MSKKITVVIPNYNGSKLLRRNLPDIIKNFPDSQIIISDDNSSDDSLNFLANNFPNMKIILKTRIFLVLVFRIEVLKTKTLY